MPPGVTMVPAMVIAIEKAQGGRHPLQPSVASRDVRGGAPSRKGGAAQHHLTRASACDMLRAAGFSDERRVKHQEP